MKNFKNKFIDSFGELFTIYLVSNQEVLTQEDDHNAIQRDFNEVAYSLHRAVDAFRKEKLDPHDREERRQRFEHPARG